MFINYGASFRDIRDKLSATIMFAEVRADVSNRDLCGTGALGVGGASIVAGNAIGESIGPNDRLEESMATSRIIDRFIAVLVSDWL